MHRPGNNLHSAAFRLTTIEPAPQLVTPSLINAQNTIYKVAKIGEMLDKGWRIGYLDGTGREGQVAMGKFCATGRVPGPN